MTIRVNPDWTQNVLAALDQTRQQQNQALAELSTGQRVNSLSDDPAAAAANVQNNIQISQTDQFLSNITDVQGLLQSADGALNNVIQTLTQTISLGVEGANGTLSSSDRQAIAEEVQGNQQELLNLANLNYQGNYVFAGTAVTTTPFVVDSSSPSGISYQGNSSTNVVEVAPGQSVGVQLPGNQLFTASGSDVFQALHDLITALQTGTSSSVAAATAEVQAAFNHVNSQRAFYGNSLSFLNSTESYLNQEKIDLSQQQNKLIAADPAAASTDLVRATDAYQAVLAASGKIAQFSLLDYLPPY